MHILIKKSPGILLAVLLLFKCSSPGGETAEQNTRADKLIGIWAWANNEIKSIQSDTLIRIGMEKAKYHDTLFIQKDSVFYSVTKYEYQKEELIGRETMKMEKKNDTLINPLQNIFLLDNDRLIFKKDTFHFVNAQQSFTPADKEGLKEIERVMNIQ